MPNTSQAQNADSSKKIASWDDAIADAENRLKEIGFSLKVFKAKKKAGEPWPLAVAVQKEK